MTNGKLLFLLNRHISLNGYHKNVSSFCKTSAVTGITSKLSIQYQCMGLFVWLFFLLFFNLADSQKASAERFNLNLLYSVTVGKCNIFKIMSGFKM